jgi:hypothetical protein
MSDFEHRKDSGRLMATQSKRNDKAPDYWGEIAIDIKDLTKVTQSNGLYVFKLNGWKRKTQAGATYLSVAIDRWVPRGEQSQANDSDVPF